MLSLYPKTLNLAKENDPQSVTHKISQFPDGQQGLTITEVFKESKEMLGTFGISIKSRLNNFRDLELIVYANQALRELGFGDVRLYIPYCLGARSDRKFKIGEVNYVKTVIAPIINLQEFSEVTVLDPHSDTLEGCINNFSRIENYELVDFAMTDYYYRINRDAKPYYTIKVLSPDAGADKKIYGVMEHMEYRLGHITAMKHRDLTTGKVVSTSVPIDINDLDKDLFIFDDICDGGRTFVEIAKRVKEMQSAHHRTGPIGRRYLVVTHGIFSNGLAELFEYFDGIYTTNSCGELTQYQRTYPQLKVMEVF